MMKYKFVKYQYTIEYCCNCETVTSEWSFAPQSEEQVVEFYDKFTLKQKADYQTKMKNNIDTAPKKWGLTSKFTLYRGHPSSIWECAHEQFARYFNRRETIDGMLEIYDHIATQTFNTMLTLIKHGQQIYLDKEGLVSRCLTADEKIIETIETDTLEFPNETKIIDNVRYIQWPDGNHWYAKFGTEDIVVDGCQKWNSKAEAEEAARKYCEKINQ